jgi:biotin carboxylase
MPRVVLLMPSGAYRAKDFLEAASAVGAEVVVASDREQALAGSMGDRALRIAYDRPDEAAGAIASLAERSPVDATVAVDDRGVVVAALASERLGLPHNPVEAVALTRDKAAQRSALTAAGLAQPSFVLVGPGDDVDGMAFPVVVKARSLSGSRGVIRADSPSDASAALERVRAILAEAGEDPDERLLVESFVPGAEVAVEGLLRDGALDVLAVFDKPDPLDGPFFEETIYVTPSRLRAERRGAVETLVARAAEALGLREGPVHAEVRLPPEGEPVLLELAARSIGGLCARTLRFGVGVSLEEVILRHALGLPLEDLHREASASGVMMLPIREAGVLREVRGVDEARAVPGVAGVEITIHPGGEVVPLPEGDRYLGFVFARGATPEEVEAALREAHARLDVVLEPR